MTRKDTERKMTELKSTRGTRPVQLWRSSGPGIFGPLQLTFFRIVVIFAGQYGELRALPPNLADEKRCRKGNGGN